MQSNFDFVSKGARGVKDGAGTDTHKASNKSGEIRRPSCQVNQKETTSSVPNPLHNANNSVSIKTGDEFAMRVLQEKVATRRVPAMNGMAQKREKNITIDSNQKGQLRYEDLTSILGLKRMDSECPSDFSNCPSANGSMKEIDNGVNLDELNTLLKEDGDDGSELRKALNELNFDSAGLGPTASFTCKSDHPQSNNFQGSGVLDGFPSGKMKFLCSFGGTFFARPSDCKLRYVGGETRILSIQKTISWKELVKKTLGIFNQPHTIKYHLPGEELDALISVSSDEDLQNMLEEYYGLERHEISQRLRIFLIPLGETENVSPYVASSIQQRNPDSQYVTAMNGRVDPGQLGTTLDCVTSSRLNHPTTKFNFEFNTSSPAAQFSNEIQNMTRSPHPSPLSPFQLKHRDTKSAQRQLCADNSFHGSIEIISSTMTTQFPPDNSNLKSTGYTDPMLGAVSLTDDNRSNKRIDAGKPSNSHGGPLDNCSPGKELANLSASDKKFTDLDGLSEMPTHKGRTLHSESPIAGLEDPMSLFSESNSSLHRVIPQESSNSKLQENGARPGFSEQGTIPSSPLNFAKGQLTSLLIPTASLEGPMQLNGNISLTHPPHEKKLLNTESAGSQRRLDSHKVSPTSQTLGRDKSMHESASNIHKKYQTAKDDDLSDSKFTIPDHSKDNLLNLNAIKDFHGNDSLLHQDGKLSVGKSTATSMQCRKSLIRKTNSTSTVGVDTSMQELQISANMVPLAAADKPCLNNTTDHQNISQSDKIPSNLLLTSQKIASNQDCTLLINGEQGRNASSSGILEVAVHKELKCQEPTPLQPIKDQKPMDLEKPMLIFSTDLNHLVNDRPNLNLHKNEHTMFIDPSKDVALNQEISLLDKDFVNYPDQTVEKLEFGVSVNKKSYGEGITSAQKEPLSKYTDVNKLDPLIIVEDLATGVQPSIQSSSEIIPCVVDESSESESEDAKADDMDFNESISDAMIAEMEASIYGLQIIKNADLEELRELGSGTYGTVYHGKWRGTDVAIKRIKKSCFAGRGSEQERLIQDFWREAKILSNLHHPNVVAFYGVVPDSTEGTLATVTEFMVNGSLRHVLLKDKSLDEHKKLIIAMDAAFGMEYLHSKNIVHFDLKCDNLLVNLRDPQRPICKVGDFGLSRVKRNTLVSGGVRGTLPWMAPELLNGSSKVSEKVDVFSFGISMWEILTSEEPYANLQCGAIIGGIVKNILRPPIPQRCDPEWRKLMEQCWSHDPETRPSFTEITGKFRSMYDILQTKRPNTMPRRMKALVSS